MPDFTVLEDGGRSAIAEPNDPDVLVRFSVRVLECDDASFEFLVHDIEGEITPVDPDGETDPIGAIRAELVNVYDLGFGQALFDAYDSRSDQLTDAFGRLYSARNRYWKPSILRLVGFRDEEPYWHLHVASLLIHPQWRRRKCAAPDPSPHASPQSSARL